MNIHMVTFEPRLFPGVFTGEYTLKYWLILQANGFDTENLLIFYLLHFFDRIKQKLSDLIIVIFIR